MITASGLVTLTQAVILLPLAAVMVWKCWNLPPVPLRRKWAIGWSGMMLAMLLQALRAEVWSGRAQRLEALLKRPEQTIQSLRVFGPSSTDRSFQSLADFQGGDVQLPGHLALSADVLFQGALVPDDGDPQQLQLTNYPVLRRTLPGKICSLRRPSASDVISVEQWEPKQGYNLYNDMHPNTTLFYMTYIV
jgi:hypothetical protein